LPTSPSTPEQKRTALIAITCATIIQVFGQLLIKTGAAQLTAQLGHEPTLMDSAIGMFTVLPIFSGYALYGLFTVIMVYALQHAELSLLYPIMALSYVGVAITSVVWFQEPINFTIVAGILVIVSGVAYLGRAESKRS
jgi:multidrug transporter EmrE-like cation transporter